MDSSAIPALSIMLLLIIIIPFNKLAKDICTSDHGTCTISYTNAAATTHA